MDSETHRLIELTPEDLYTIQQKRRQENEKESSRVLDYFRSLLRETLKEEIVKGRVIICETRLSVSRFLRSERNHSIIIDTSFAWRISPTVRIIFPNSTIVEVVMSICKRAVLETRILPKDTNQFQRLKTYLSDWESRSSYFPEKRKPEMVLFHTEDCKGVTIKEMCKLTVSKVIEIVTEKTRLTN